MILGITGTSGSGKHTAAEFLAQKGWVILDADQIAHHLYRPYTHVWKAIVKSFGEAVLGQHDHIDRQRLGKRVFTDPKKLKKLNDIVHPALIHYLTDQLYRHDRRERSVAVVAALWKELKLRDLCNQILLIKIQPELAYRRLQLKEGISRDEFKKRLQNQSIPRNPDFMIENNSSRQAFYQAIARLPLSGSLR